MYYMQRIFFTVRDSLLIVIQLDKE